MNFKQFISISVLILRTPPPAVPTNEKQKSPRDRSPKNLSKHIKIMHTLVGGWMCVGGLLKYSTPVVGGWGRENK